MVQGIVKNGAKTMSSNRDGMKWITRAAANAMFHMQINTHFMLFFVSLRDIGCKTASYLSTAIAVKFRIDATDEK